jgi:hypothetical protein
VSQEQKDRVEQAEGDIPVTPLPPTTAATSKVEEIQKAQEEEQASAGAVPTTAKKRGKRKTRLVNVEEISPRPSYWPLALAFSLAIVLFGVIGGLLFVVIGVLLALVSVGGWVLERR